MKILLLVPDLPPKICGIGDYTSSLARELARRGEAVDIITTERVFVDPVPGVSVHPVVSEWNWKALFKIVRMVRDLNPDVVNWQFHPFLYGRKGLAPSFAFLPLLIRALSTAKIVVTFHELYFPFSEPGYGLKGFIWALVQSVEFLLIGLAAQGLVATTKARVRSLKRLFPWKQRYAARFPVGSNIHPIPISGGEKRRLRSRLGVSAETVLLGIFGTLSQHRSLLTIVRSLERLSRTHEFRLLCIGQVDTSCDAWKEAMVFAKDAGIDSLVLVTGPGSPQEVSALFQALNLYLALYEEGASAVRTTLMTGIAHGVPTIATRGPETDPDWFVHGENLFLLDRFDVDRLTEAILHVIDDADVSTRLREGALKTFERNFSWRVIAGRQLELMRRIVGVPAEQVGETQLRRIRAPKNLKGLGSGEAETKEAWVPE